MKISHKRKNYPNKYVSIIEEDKMPVKIEMDMPRNCSECEFLNISYRYITCVASKGEQINVNVVIRQSWCPLQEVKE